MYRRSDYKARTRSLIVLFSVMMFAAPSPCVASSEKNMCDPAKVSISIDAIVNRIHPPKHCANAVLDLRFCNSNTRGCPAEIAFTSGIWWMNAEIEKKTGNIEPLLGNAQQADFSVLSYSIFSEKKKPVFSNSIDLSGSDLIIPPNKSAVKRIPITLPTIIGRYTIEVFFDNVRLKDSLSTSPDSSRCTLLKCSAKKDFSISKEFAQYHTLSEEKD